VRIEPAVEIRHHRLGVARAVLEQCRRHAGDAGARGATAGHERRIADLVDVDSVKFVSYGEQGRGPLARVHRREGLRLLAFERRVASAFDRTLFVSEAEAALFRSLAPEVGARVEAMENGVDTDYFDPAVVPVDAARASVPGAVFTGAMDYAPNADAVVWFCEAVWPQVLARQPQARFAIVGARPGPRVCALAALPGVTVTGTVPDVRPWLAEAWVSVAPLRIARGIQNKVLEAMAMGRPVVASTACAGPIAANLGEELLAAESAADYFDRIDELLANRAHADNIGRAARRRVLEHYSWDAHLALIDRFLEEMSA